MGNCTNSTVFLNNSDPDLVLHEYVYCSRSDYSVLIFCLITTFLALFLVKVLMVLENKEKDLLQPLTIPINTNSHTNGTSEDPYPGLQTPESKATLSDFWKGSAYLLIVCGCLIPFPAMAFALGITAISHSTITLIYISLHFGLQGINSYITPYPHLIPVDPKLDQISDYWLKKSINDFLSQHPNEKLLYIDYQNTLRILDLFLFTSTVTLASFLQCILPPFIVVVGTTATIWMILFLMLPGLFLTTEPTVIFTTNSIVEYSKTPFGPPQENIFQWRKKSFKVKEQLMFVQISRFDYLVSARMERAADDPDKKKRRWFGCLSNPEEFQSVMKGIGVEIKFEKRHGQRLIFLIGFVIIGLCSLVWIGLLIGRPFEEKEEFLLGLIYTSIPSMLVGSLMMLVPLFTGALIKTCSEKNGALAD